MHAASNVNNETMKDTISRTTPAFLASSGFILPDGTGLSGWAVLSISLSM